MDTLIDKCLNNRFCRWASRNWPIIAWLVSFALIAIGILRVEGLANRVDQEAVARSEANRIAAIENCHRIGDPIADSIHVLAVAEREAALEDLAQSKTINYHELFPHFEPHELKVLIQQGREADQTRADRFDVIASRILNLPTCEQRYPPLPR